MDKIEEALLRQKQGSNCCQSILLAYGPDLGMDEDTALKVAAAFGAGMGRLGDTCGAMTGALMVLGLKYGTQRGATYPLVTQFATQFKSRNGSLMCRDLLGHDMSIPEELKFVNDNRLIATMCPKFVRDAAEILEQLLA